MTAVSPLSAVVGELKQVPEEFADYSTPPDVAARFLQVSEEDVLSFAEAGVCFRAGPDGLPRFEFADIYNLASLSGQGRSVFELGLRFLMRFSAERPESWFVERQWSVKVVPPDSTALKARVPDDDCENVRQLEVNLPGQERGADQPLDGDYIELPTAGVEYRVRLRGRHDTVQHPSIISAYTEVFDALIGGAISYQTVPEVLRSAADVAWDLGIADCVVVSQVLATRLRAAGHAARARRGYLLGLLGSDHAWTEVFEGGRWKQLDPVAAALATGKLRELGFSSHPDFLSSCRGSSFNRFLPCRTYQAEPLLLLADGTAPQWITCAISASPTRAE